MASSSRRAAAQPAATGTQTQTENPPRRNVVGTLRLRGEPAPPRRGIRWAEDVVDNEGLGRKKSKVCCIYHRPRAVGESSSDSSSSSSSDSDTDSEADDEKGAEHTPGRGEEGEPSRQDDQEPAEGDPACSHRRCKKKRKPKARGEGRRPNAYEKMPRNRKGGSRTGTTTIEK